MFLRLGNAVARYWWLTILIWLGVVVGLRVVAPRWDDITRDGDLAFLPSDMPSVVGERLRLGAFPENRANSQIVLIFSRADEPLLQADLKAADRFASRFHNYLAMRLAAEDKDLAASLEQLDEALRLDPENAEALHNRAIVRLRLGQRDVAQTDRLAAWQQNPELQSLPDTLVPQKKIQLPLVDVWTRHNEVVGSKLRSADKQAQLIILQLDTEFMAVENIASLILVQREVEALRGQLRAEGFSGLQVDLSGSAAIGGDMLLSAAESIKNTELYTIILVILILLVVYRAPLIVIVPLVTIGVSLSVSINVLSLLADLAETSGFEWWRFKVFKTTKIFIVVILFGAGTDFCLFLIARFRECLEEGTSHAMAIPRALAGVGDALTASALTTIVGLGMMFFADFGKFRSSGPAIGMCLLVTLVACLTLAPALLRALGSAVFWPFHPRPAVGPQQQPQRRFARLWDRLARLLVKHPGKILVACVLLLAPLAYFGSFSADHTTFDLLNSLARTRASYLGSVVLKQHFPIGEGGPIIVLAEKHDAGFDSEDRRTAAVAMGAIFDLTAALTEIEGVTAVRSLAEPLGDPPKWSLTQTRKNILRQHRLTKSIFLAQSAEHRGNVTRFELILNHDPFSSQAIETLARAEKFLAAQTAQPDSFWRDAEFSFAGTTAGIRDLRDVTRSDRWRIQVLVVLAVYLVLVVILRQPVVCMYLIASVLFSYFITIGATELFFMWQYGDTFQGLDWKVPIFLFVILVAVGEDYNIYLVTRITEEQQLRGPFAGLREGVVRTGGIITSCGLIMAGTFVSMTTGTLRGVVELGFALSLGVLFDTFVVRTILVPAFLAVLLRVSAWRSRHEEVAAP